MEKAALIARKHEIIARMARIRRELGRENQPSSRGERLRRQQLLRELDTLMAEEYRLRLQIDRSR